MTKQSLQEIRADWEENLKVLIEVPVYVKNTIPQEMDNLIVVLKDVKHNIYMVNRYFQAGACTECDKHHYHVSVDFTCQDPKDILNYIEKSFPEGLKTNTL